MECENKSDNEVFENEDVEEEEEEEDDLVKKESNYDREDSKAK
jgi:hypothetical protein